MLSQYFSFFHLSRLSGWYFLILFQIISGMQNFYNSVKSGGLKVCELLTPVLRESKFQVSSLHFRILLIKVSDSYGSALWENLIQAVKIAEKKVFYKNYPDFCVSSFVYLYWWKSITAYSDENNNKGTFFIADPDSYRYDRKKLLLCCSHLSIYL